MNKQVLKGIKIMLLSSLLTCTGQLIWKLAALQLHMLAFIYCLTGLALYAIGALFMLIAFQFGELSILQPILSFGYVISIFLALMVLKEPITIKKVMGVLLISIGIILLSRTGMGQTDE